MLAARRLPPLSAISVEVLGAEAEYGPHARVEGPREVVLKIAAKHPQSSALDLLLREATSTGTSMSPGITGMGGNRPKVAPVVRLFSFLAAVRDIPVRVHMAGEAVDVAPPIGGDGAGPPSEPHRVEEPVDLADTIAIPLVRLAWGRSGDKGDNANIGVIARRPDYLPWIRRALSEETVARRFAHLCEGEVTRFDVPGIQGLNFLLTRALGGGGIASLRNDPQGKGYAQILLDQPVRISRAIAVRDGLI
jgi:hypothetical protein